jgi:hypothetical protein
MPKPKPATARTFVTPPELAREYGVRVQKVLG